LLLSTLNPSTKAVALKYAYLSNPIGIEVPALRVNAPAILVAAAPWQKVIKKTEHRLIYHCF